MFILLPYYYNIFLYCQATGGRKMQKTKELLNRNPFLYLVIGVLAMSCSGIIIKLTNAPSAIIAFYRMFITAVILSPGFFSGNKEEKSAGTVIENKALYLFPIMTGLVNAADYVLGTIGLKNTSIANNSIIGNLSPVWVGLATIFIFKKKLSAKYWLGMLLALAGSMLVIGKNFYTLNFHFSIGDLCAAASSIFYAAYFVLTEKGRKYFSASEFFTMMLYSTCFWLFLLNIIQGNSFTNYDLQTWIYFFISAIVCQLIGQFAISASLGFIPSEIVSITMLLHPILMTILAYPILGESVDRFQIIGGCITLAGVILVNKEKSAAENTNTEEKAG